MFRRRYFQNIDVLYRCPITTSTAFFVPSTQIIVRPIRLTFSLSLPPQATAREYPNSRLHLRTIRPPTVPLLLPMVNRPRYQRVWTQVRVPITHSAANRAVLSSDYHFLLFCPVGHRQMGTTVSLSLYGAKLNIIRCLLYYTTQKVF